MTAALQLVFIALSIVGWVAWRRSMAERSSRAGRWHPRRPRSSHDHRARARASSCRRTPATCSSRRRARQHADEVVVCLLAHPDEPIPVEVRHAWLEELLPWATIRSGVATHPIDYEDPAVYDLWAATIKDVIGRDGVDVLLTSEPAYGDMTAERLGARHVLVDPDAEDRAGVGRRRSGRTRSRTGGTSRHASGPGT